MESTSIRNFSLNPNILREIPFHKYENNFTFIVNGERYKTNRIISDILSPIIRKFHFTDESINEFCVNTHDCISNERTSQKDYFLDFLDLISFKETEIDSDHQKAYLKYFYQLGNIDEYIKLQPQLFTEITIDNVIDRLNFLSRMADDFPESERPIEIINKLTHFISKNFDQIDKKGLKNIKIEYFFEILNKETLRINDEDSLLLFLLSLYEEDHSYSVLFESVLFSNVSDEVLKKFLEIFEFDDLNYTIWTLICDRLIGNKHNMNERYKKIKAKENIVEVSYKKGNEFDGIFKYLTDESGGNIHDNGTIDITSNSIQSNNSSYHPKNLVNGNDRDYYWSQNLGNATICFDFKDMSIQLDNYSIKTISHGPNGKHLRNWVVEVSNNGNEWEIIDRHENDSSLNRNRFVSTFNIKNQNNKYYRFVQIRQTGNGWDTSLKNEVALYTIEFFRKIKKKV